MTLPDQLPELLKLPFTLPVHSLIAALAVCGRTTSAAVSNAANWREYFRTDNIELIGFSFEFGFVELTDGADFWRHMLMRAGSSESDNSAFGEIVTPKTPFIHRFKR